MGSIIRTGGNLPNPRSFDDDDDDDFELGSSASSRSLASSVGEKALVSAATSSISEITTGLDSAIGSLGKNISILPLKYQIGSGIVGTIAGIALVALGITGALGSAAVIAIPVAITGTLLVKASILITARACERAASEVLHTDPSKIDPLKHQVLLKVLHANPEHKILLSDLEKTEIGLDPSAIKKICKSLAEEKKLKIVQKENGDLIYTASKSAIKASEEAEKKYEKLRAEANKAAEAKRQLKMKAQAESQAKLQAQSAQAVKSPQQNDRDRVLNLFSSKNQKVNGNFVRNKLKIEAKAARLILEELSKEGVLQKTKTGKSVFYQLKAH